MNEDRVELAATNEGEESNLKTVKFSESTGDFGGDAFRDRAGIDQDSPDTPRDFSFSKYGFTPSIDRIQKSNMRPSSQADDDRPKVLPVSKGVEIAPRSSMTRPNYEDFIKRVAIVTHRHVQKCEERLKNASASSLETGVFHFTKMQLFNEELYLIPKYCYDFTTSPITRLGFQYTIRRMKPFYRSVPSFTEIHSFLKNAFDKASLTAECSIVCLIYCERLMENAHVALVSQTWRPILLCCLLLASKVWEDQGTWNVDLAEVFPQYSVQGINKLEKTFCQEINWNLNIKSSEYAKYYFALRGITAERDFRRNYNQMMHIPVPGADKIATRSEDLKSQVLAKSL